jgi:hypothetical protein
MPKRERSESKASRRREAVADAVLRLRDALAAAAPPSGRWDAAQASALRAAIARRLDGNGEGDGADLLKSLGVLLGFLLSSPRGPVVVAEKQPKEAAAEAAEAAPPQPPAKRRRREDADAAAPPPPPPPKPAPLPPPAPPAPEQPPPPPPSQPLSPLRAALRAFGVEDDEAVSAELEGGRRGEEPPERRQRLWASVCGAMERARTQAAGPALAAPPEGVLTLYSRLAALCDGDAPLTLLHATAPEAHADAEAHAAVVGALPCLWLPDDDNDDNDKAAAATAGRLYAWDELCWRDPSRGVLEAMHRAQARVNGRQRAVEAAWPALARAGVLAVAEEDDEDEDEDDDSDSSSSNSESSSDSSSSSETSSSDDDDDGDDGDQKAANAATTTGPKPLRLNPTPRALCAAVAFSAASPGALRRCLTPNDDDPDAARWACISGALAALGAALLARRQQPPPAWLRSLSRALTQHHALRAANGGHWVSLSQRPYCDWPQQGEAREESAAATAAAAAAAAARRLLQGAPGVHLVSPVAADGSSNSIYCAALALAAVGVVPLAAAAFPVMVAPAANGNRNNGPGAASRPPRPTAWPLAAGAVSRALPTLQATFQQRLGSDLTSQLWRRALEPALQRLAVCSFSSSSSPAPLPPCRLAVPVAQGPPALSANEPTHLLACPAVLDGGRLLLEASGNQATTYLAAARELLRLALRSAALLPPAAASSSSSFALAPTEGVLRLLLDFDAIAGEFGAAIERSAASGQTEGEEEGAEGGDDDERWALPFAPLLPEPRTDGAGLGLLLPLPPGPVQAQEEEEEEEEEEEAKKPPPPPPPPPFTPYDPLRRAFSRPADAQAVRPLLAAPLPPAAPGSATVEEETRELPPRLEGRFRWQDTSAVAAAAARGGLREFLVGARALRAANADAALPSGVGAIPGAGGGGSTATTARDRNAAVGRWGELVALHHLRQTIASGGGAAGPTTAPPPTAPPIEVEWCNARGEAGLPYDLVVRPLNSQDESEWHYVEVKSSASPDKVLFEVSWREMAFAARKGARFSVVRVFGAAGGGFGAGGAPVRLLHASDPVALWSQGALAVCMVV